MWFDAASPAAADKGFAQFGLIFQLNGGRTLRGTLVAVQTKEGKRRNRLRRNSSRNNQPLGGLN